MSSLPVSQALAQALQHLQAGRLGEAETLYRQVLSVEPGQVEALQHLGIIAHQVGQSQVARQLLERASALAPGYAIVHSNLGVILSDTGHIEEAIAAYQRALQLDPGYAQANVNLGNAFRALQRWDQAIDAYRCALRAQPDSPNAATQLGDTLLILKRVDEAIAVYRHALTLDPDSAVTLNNLANALTDQDDFDQAILLYERALALAPTSAEAHYNLAIALKGKRRFAEAIAVCRRSLELNPAQTDCWSVLGIALAESNQLEQALACQDRVLAAEPPSARAHLNRGATLCLQGRFREGESDYRQAIALQPDFADAHLSLGALMLLLERGEEGWREYEWRWRSRRHTHRHHDYDAPRWDGGPAPGKTILIHAEQGFGDTLQFVRLLPMASIAAGGARLVFACPAPLIPLLRQLETPTLEFVAFGPSSPAPTPFDLQVPLLSLPPALGCLQAPAIQTPYLQANPRLRAQWRERLNARAALRVGVACSGNPEHEHDLRRSLAPEALLPLLRHSDVQFVSLQIGPQAPWPAAFAASGLLDPNPEIRDFADSAALIAELDLIITVDTAPAHLAGALGRPVWVLLPYVPDWRWGLGRETTPWYPTMRLFRQPKPGDWTEPLAGVSAAFSTFLENG